MLIVSVVYLFLEIGFRSFAIETMGSFDLQSAEIEYLEVVGRIFAATGFSIFTVGLFKNMLFMKKAILFFTMLDLMV